MNVSQVIAVTEPDICSDKESLPSSRVYDSQVIAVIEPDVCSDKDSLPSSQVRETIIIRLVFL